MNVREHYGGVYAKMIMSESQIDIRVLEKEIYRYCCEFGREMFRTILMKLDDALMVERDRQAYRHKGKRKAVLKTIMGEVEYERAIYRREEENGAICHVYLLDEVLGSETVGFMSDMLAQRIAETSCELSYRRTAETVSNLTGQSISHTGAWRVTQVLGERVNLAEREAAARAKSNQGRGTKETKLLFEEQDGVYLTLQGEDRKVMGKTAEMKIAIAYTGAVETGTNRYNLTGKVACANFEGIDGFFERKEGVIAEEYNVDEIQMRIFNGDGAGWMRRNITDETVHYQLDTYHRNKAIVQCVSNADARRKLFELLYSKQIDLLLAVACPGDLPGGDA